MPARKEALRGHHTEQPAADDHDLAGGREGARVGAEGEGAPVEAGALEHRRGDARGDLVSVRLRRRLRLRVRLRLMVRVRVRVRVRARVSPRTF